MNGVEKLYKKTTENFRLLTGKGWKVDMETGDKIEKVKENEVNDSDWNNSRNDEQPLNLRKKDESIDISHKFSEAIEEILKPESPRLPTNNDENAVVADFTGNLDGVDDFLGSSKPRF